MKYNLEKLYKVVRMGGHGYCAYDIHGNGYWGSSLEEAANNLYADYKEVST